MAVTGDQVKAIFTTRLTAAEMAPFIASAGLIVSEQLAGKGLSQARLDQIELYLAAHFATITDERGGLQSTSAGEAEDRYAFKAGEGLASTRYGQQAISFDTSGTLASLTATNKPVRKAQFRVMEQDDLPDNIW